MTAPRLATGKHVRRLAILLGTFAAVAVAVPVAAADAQVYCVHDPSCPAGGVAKDTLTEALIASDADAAKDTVRLGPGVFASSAHLALNPVAIVGAGVGATEVDNYGPLTSGIYLHEPTSTVADLSVRLTKDQQVGVELWPGASAERVKVTAPHNLTQEQGFAASAGSDMQSVVVDLGDDPSSEAIFDHGDATVGDATLTAYYGIVADAASAIVRRVTVRATVPLFAHGGTVNVANALLVPHPDDPQSPSFTAARVESGEVGQNGLLNAADLTIVGGGAGTGVEVHPDIFAFPDLGPATANVQGAIISGVAHSLSRYGQSILDFADVNIDHSAYDASTISEGPGDGAITDKGGSLTSGPDPRFVNPAAGDYRLRFDSPLLDKGPPTEPLSSDDPDLGGRSRMRDSDGNGSAVRDIGAHEYQRLAPTPAFALQPGVAQLGQATAFDATQSSDPDGDPLSLAWAFGDGATGSGANASHTYGTPGSYQATLIAIDATGLSATATHTASVAAPPSTPGAGPPSGPGSSSSPAPTSGSPSNPSASSPSTGSSSQPVISGLAQSTGRWLQRGARTHANRSRRLPVGTTFRFSLDQPADVRFAFTQTLTGRKVSGKCVAQNKRNTRNARCRRTVTAGTLSAAGHAGANQLRFRGRTSSGRKLKPGRYTLTATATNAAGQHSLPRSLTFTIAKP
jgi:hypothetical protein